MLYCALNAQCAFYLPRGVDFWKVWWYNQIKSFTKGVNLMTKIDIYSGFLGAGKTTLIKKMIQEGYKGQKLVLIENEFGEIGIDGGFLQPIRLF